MEHSEYRQKVLAEGARSGMTPKQTLKIIRDEQETNRRRLEIMPIVRDRQFHVLQPIVEMGGQLERNAVAMKSCINQIRSDLADRELYQHSRPLVSDPYEWMKRRDANEPGRDAAAHERFPDLFDVAFPWAASPAEFDAQSKHARVTAARGRSAELTPQEAQKAKTSNSER